MAKDPELSSEVRPAGVNLSLLSSTGPTRIVLISRKRCSASCWIPPKVKRTRGRSRALMKAPKLFLRVRAGPLELEAGQNFYEADGRVYEDHLEKDC